MAKRQGQCLNRSQNSIVLFFIFLFGFFTDGVAAWYQLNLFKDRSDWWSRPDITSPAEILVKESSGYVCIAANRPIENTAMDAVVVWNRPELRGTNVRAVAFYNGQNCGASPDPNTGELPLPSAILVLSSDNPYGVSAFTLASQNLEFLWGSYQAFDLRGEYHPGRILAQFVEENLSGTVILKDPNPADPSKPYKTPVKALRILKEDQFQPLTKTVDINALMRQAGETALLSTEETKSELVRSVTRLLMEKLLQDIATEKARGEEIRRRLAATSAAAEGTFGGTMGSATNAATGSVAGSQLASDVRGSNNVNLAQTSLNNPSSMNFPLPGGQPYPGHSSNVQPGGNTLQNPSQPSSQRGQQYSSYINVPSSQGLQGNIPQYYTQDLGTPPPNTASQRINPSVGAGGNIYPSTGGTQRPIAINPRQSSALGARSSPSNPSTANMMAEVPTTESNRQNTIPGIARQGQPEQPNTYILPRQGPIPLHPDLIGALVRGDDPRILDARGVDMNGILQTYYPQSDKHKWLETFKVFKRNVDKAVAVAQQLFELGERGGVPPPGYRPNQGLAHGSQRMEGIPQTQNLPPNGSANQPPTWGQSQPRGGQYPNNEAAQVGSQPNTSQQSAAFNVGSNLAGGYRPGQMQMEAPQQNSGGEQQAPNTQNRQPYISEGPTSARTDPYAQIQTAPLGAGRQMEQADSRGQLIARQQMQQSQPPAVNPNLSQGQDSYLGRIPSTQPQTTSNINPQVDLPQVSDDEQDRTRNNLQNPERRGMLVEGPGIEPLSTPGVYRLGLPTRNDHQSVPLSEPFMIGRPPQDTGGTQNIPRPETEAIVASNRQNPFGGGSIQPRINNVQWMQGQAAPLRKQPAQAEQPRSRSGVAPGAQNIAGEQVTGEPVSSRYPQASFNTNPNTSQEPRMQEEPTESTLPIQGQEGLQMPSNIAPEYREIPTAGQQLQQGGQNQEEYVPSPDVIFPDWSEEFVAPELDTSSSEDETELEHVQPTFGVAGDRVPRIVGQNEDVPEPLENPGNIPAMFQRASPSNFNTGPPGQIPVRNNQRLLNRPSVGQLRPSRGGTGSSRVEQSDSSLDPSPARDEEQQGRGINPSIARQPNLVAATGSSEPEAEVFEASGIEEEGNQESNIGQEVIELDQRPDIFDRNQELSPEVVPFQYIQEELTPASAQSVIDEVSGDIPQLGAQQETTGRQVTTPGRQVTTPGRQFATPELNLESYPDREFQDMVCDIIWGKPFSSGTNLNSLFSGRGSHILPGVRNPAISDEQLLRPPPMRRPPQGIQITHPNLKDPNVVELDLAHTYSRILSQLQKTAESQRQPNAEKIPGYITPQFLRSLIPNPAVNPFSEEDNNPLFPSAFTKSLNPDLTREQIWDRPYEYTDPMLDKEFTQQQLREEKERRENELLSDPLNAWRAQLKAMARFQQRRRPKPGDIRSWAGPQFLNQESSPRFDSSMIVTEEQMDALENPQDYDWGWDDAEDSLVVKKRKMNPS